MAVSHHEAIGTAANVSTRDTSDARADLTSRGDHESVKTDLARQAASPRDLVWKYRFEVALCEEFFIQIAAKKIGECTPRNAFAAPADLGPISKSCLWKVYETRFHRLVMLT